MFINRYPPPNPRAACLERLRAEGEMDADLLRVAAGFMMITVQHTSSLSEQSFNNGFIRAILQKCELLLGAPLDKLEGDVATDTALDLLQEVRLG